MNNNTNQFLAEKPLGKLMLQFSIPCILSLLVSSLYNIVDQIFIGRGVGYLGNGATNVVFPITVIALALALMTGDGCAAFLSICQGKKDSEGAKHSVGNAISLLILFGIILTVIFVAGRDAILNSFGATEKNIDYAIDYFNIIVIGIPFYVFTSGMSGIIRADGNPKFSMIATLVGCIINVILDPVAIFVLGWGVKGAALATIVGQIVSAIISFYYLFHTKSFRLDRESLVPRKKYVTKILPLGISSFLTQISIVVVMGVMNSTLVKYGAKSVYGADIPMTVMGIVMKVFQIVIAFVVGIAAGCQPIIGFNYGAGHIDRVKKLFKYIIGAEIVVGAISTILFEFFPVQIISLFGSEGGLYNEFATLSFRIYLSTIILCCIIKSSSIFLQALGKPVMSMSLSLLRDFILSVPLIIGLAVAFGVTGPLYVAPIADVVTFIVTIVLALITFKNIGKINK